MREQATGQTVHRAITLAVGVERAFAVFTEEIGRWWPIENTFANVALGQPGLFETVMLVERHGPSGAIAWRKAMESREGWSTFLDHFAIASTPDRT